MSLVSSVPLTACTLVVDGRVRFPLSCSPTSRPVRVSSRGRLRCPEAARTITEIRDLKTRAVPILAVALGLLLSPMVAESQQAAGKMYRLGILSPGGAPNPSVPTMVNLVPKALAELGYVEGKNLAVDRRYADDKFDRLP